MQTKAYCTCNQIHTKLLKTALHIWAHFLAKSNIVPLRNKKALCKKRSLDSVSLSLSLFSLRLRLSLSLSIYGTMTVVEIGQFVILGTCAPVMKQCYLPLFYDYGSRQISFRLLHSIDTYRWTIKGEMKI